MTDEQTAVYREALTVAKATFRDATKRLDDIRYEEYVLTQEIAKLRRTITALAPMCGEDGMDDLGITESCVEVMDIQRGMVTTPDVIKALEAIGFDLGSQKNIAASVGAVLNRLARRGQVQKVINEDGEVVKWKGKNFDPNYVIDDEIPF